MSTDPTMVTVRIAVDRFLASPYCRKPTTRRSYGNVLDRIAEHLGPGRPLAEVTGVEFGQALQLWASAAASTWKQRRAAINSFLTWCIENGYPAPPLPTGIERQPEQRGKSRPSTDARSSVC